VGAARAQQLSDVEVEVEWLNTYVKLILKAPSFALIEKAFKVGGTTPGANQDVAIMLKEGV
jgi:hypothetical protein